MEWDGAQMRLTLARLSREEGGLDWRSTRSTALPESSPEQGQPSPVGDAAQQVELPTETHSMSSSPYRIQAARPDDLNC
ncbi:MAG: hypothetical protein JWO91_3432 [Acidobacteriaceae bacterium]|nr:hypothetical protein [Acidobacteriaceae bacterium]